MEKISETRYNDYFIIQEKERKDNYYVKYKMLGISHYAFFNNFEDAVEFATERYYSFLRREIDLQVI